MLLDDSNSWPPAAKQAAAWHSAVVLLILNNLESFVDGFRWEIACGSTPIRPWPANKTA